MINEILRTSACIPIARAVEYGALYIYNYIYPTDIATIIVQYLHSAAAVDILSAYEKCLCKEIIDEMHGGKVMEINHKIISRCKIDMFLDRELIKFEHYYLHNRAGFYSFSGCNVVTYIENSSAMNIVKLITKTWPQIIHTDSIFIVIDEWEQIK